MTLRTLLGDNHYRKNQQLINTQLEITNGLRKESHMGPRP